MDHTKNEWWLNYRENHIQFLIRRAGMIFSLFILVNAIAVLPMGKWSWISFVIAAYIIYNWKQERRCRNLKREEYLVNLGIFTVLTALGASYTAVLYQLLITGIISNTGKAGAVRTAVVVSVFYLSATLIAAGPITIAYTMNMIYQLLSFAVLTVAVSYLHILLRKQSDSEQQMKALTKENDLKQKMVLTDDLTGLYNYRAYKQKVDGFPQYVLLVIDIDRFKKLNDTYGHGFGNKVLVNLGGIIRQAIRTSDMAFRYGGEEFVLVLPGASESLGYKIAERLRQRVEETSFLFGKQEVKVTVSIGISVKSPGSDSQTVFEQADSALYRAKQQGRNNVQCFQQSMEMVCQL